MAEGLDLGRALADAWRTNDRVTRFLVEGLPAPLWSERVPGNPRWTFGMLAAHIHNARCMWIKSIGARHGVQAPERVAARRVRPRELVRALSRSSDGMLRLIDLGLSRGGAVPPATWQNFPTDLAHFLSYFVSHEAHHRGQLCLAARHLGYRLPPEVRHGLWQWKQRARESAARPARDRPRRTAR